MSEKTKKCVVGKTYPKLVSNDFLYFKRQNHTMFTVLKSLLQNARMDDAKLNKCKKLKTVNTRLTNS